MVAYRSKMEIIGDILVSAEEKTIEQDGASIMHLIRHVNIPHTRLSKILSNLVSQGLLEQVNSDRAYKYRISIVGKDFRAEDFELGRGVNFSINEIADCFGEDHPREYLPERPGEYDMTLADSSKAKELLDWNPTHNIKDYIKQWIYEDKYR